MDRGRCLLRAFAHPDDEGFGSGGAIAKYASLGVRVVLVCGTGGEVGEIRDPALATPENLVEVRRQEMLNAGRVLGAAEVRFLGYRDSGMAGTDDNEHPDSLHQADMEEATGRLVRIIRDVRPHVVVTHDSGGDYDHPDHVAMSRVGEAAFRAAGDARRYPDQLVAGLEPWSPAKLYYAGFPRSSFRWLVDRMKEAGVEPPFSDRELESVGVPDDAITTVIDVDAFVEKKLSALACHATQIDSQGPLGRLPPEVVRQMMGTEHYQLVEPPPAGRETDLFVGLE